jgi:hypothetical protein
MDQKTIPIEAFAKAQGISAERVRQYCKANRIKGAVKIGEGRRGVWVLPADANITRRRPGRPTLKVRLAQYPQLLAISWHLGSEAEVHERDALALYEANWRFVDAAALSQGEKVFIERLTQKYGKGLLNV